MEQGQQAREKVNEALMASVDIPVPEGVIAAEVDAHFEDGHEASDEHRAEIEQQSREALKSQFILDRMPRSRRPGGRIGVVQLAAAAGALVQHGSGRPGAGARGVRSGVHGPVGHSPPKALAWVLENATVIDSNGDAVDLQALNPNSTKQCKRPRWRNSRRRWPPQSPAVVRLTANHRPASGCCSAIASLYFHIYRSW